LDAFESIVGAKYLDAIDSSVLSQFATALTVRKVRRGGVDRPISLMTVKSLLAEIRRALNWAHFLDLLPEKPRVRMPGRVERPRGRPLTGEEFDRMLDAVPSVVADRAVASWQFLLRGLWLSGLRLSEALRVTGPTTLRGS
jgi:integrase